MQSPLRIVADDLSSEQTRALVRLHLQGMHAISPPGQVFALDLGALASPEITVFSAWFGDSIAGIGALRDHGGGLGEVKSMRTHPSHLRRGVGAALLDTIIGEARARRMRTLSLETGTGPAFEAALALYLRRGFVEGEPFADYERSEFNRLLHLELAPIV
jgi:putative acetyltransferase